MKEGKVFKRILAIALVVVMTITMMPFGVFAAEGTGDAPCAHTEATSVAKKTPTCKEAGNIAHYVCNGCSEIVMPNDSTDLTKGFYVYTKSVARDKDPNKHVDVTEVVNAREATCVAEGYTGDTVYKCCGLKVADGTATDKVAHNIDGVTALTRVDDDYHGKKCNGDGCNEILARETHDWEEATCTTPKTCKDCGATKGEVAEHAWNEATCILAKTCGTCGTTEGTPNGHDWEAATCTAAKTCKVCGTTQGNVLAHNYSAADGKCDNCEAVCPHTNTENFGVTNPANCTEYGQNPGKKCSLCKYVVEAPSTAEPLGHNLTKTAAKAPKCAEAGNIEYWTCSRCGKLFNAEAAEERNEITLANTVVAATGHDETGEFAVVSNPTCTTAGSKEKKCKTCKEVIDTEAIAATGHDETGEFAVVSNPTCTTAGSKEKKCKTCQEVIATEAINALGHDETGEFTIVTNATCTTPGSKEKKCKTCQEVIATETINALGHDVEGVDFEAIKVGETTTEHGKKCKTCGEYASKANHAYTTLVKKELATCVTTGIEINKCVCDETETKTLPVNDSHDWGAFTTTLEPTCTAEGSKERTCKRDDCTGKDVVEIPAAGHKMTKTEAKEATCKDAGNIEFYTCSACNKYFKDEAGNIEVEKAATVTPATNDHKFTVYVVTTDGTCTENGKETATCDVCKTATHERVMPGTMLAHSYKEYKSNGDATCKVDGTMTAVCDMCKVAKDTKTEVDSHKTAAHTPNEAGTHCTLCGAELVCLHTYSAGKLITKTPTCTEKGQEAIVCSKCNAHKPGSEAELPAKGHAWDEGEIIKDATCSEKGSKKLKCNNMCGETKTEEIAVKPHNYKEVITHATCTEAGYSTFTCTMCGSHYVDKPVEAYGHMFETYFYDEGSATCYQDGTKTAECANGCGTKNTVADPGSKTDHEMTDFTVITPATCTEDGEEEAKCFYHEKCGYSEIVPVEALGHDDSGEFVETKAATCTEKGEKQKTCTRCPEIVATEEIPALGHDETAEFVETLAATCTTDGSKEKKCARCSEVIATEAIPALGHDIAAEYTIDVPATCTTEGSQSKHCSRCDYKDGVVAIPASGHDMQPGEGTTATCTEPGKAVFVCANGCGKTHEEANVPALGHSFTYTSNGDATCQADGTKTGKCIRCDVTETVADEGSMLEHVFGEPVIDKASTEKGGLVTTKCTNCEYEEVEEIAMIDSLKLKYETVVYDGKYKRPSLTITDAEGAKLIKGEDYLLELPEKDECINAGTYTYTVTFIGNYEGEATLTYKVVPGKASKIVSKGTKQTYIDLKWSTVKGADGYRIYVKTSSGGWKKLATVKGKTTYRVKDLKAGTNYTFAVKAFSKAADGETTIWATEFAEQAFKTLPGKTSKLTAKTNKNAVKLTWKEVKGAEGYRVYVKTAKGGWKTVATVKGGKVTYTVKELKANTTYEYAVKAFYKDGSATVWSNQFTTVKAKTAK